MVGSAFVPSPTASAVPTTEPFPTASAAPTTEAAPAASAAPTTEAAPAVAEAPSPTASATFPQNAEIAGRVWSEDGTPVEGAVVRLFLAAADSESPPLRIGATDGLGYFSFADVAPGEYRLVVERLGFAPHETAVQASGPGRVEVEAVLSPQAIELAGVVVEAERSRARARFEETAGATIQEIERGVVKAIPGVAEADPVRAVEVLPGVTTVSDFSAAFNVRGGSADQNLILLDDVQIFNPFHLGGFFSVFNADMVARAELQSGGFPAEYGGRVSSVLSVESDPGDGRFGVDAGVSLLATRTAVNGSLPAGLADGLGLANARWRVSGRRSYFDVVFRPWTTVPYHLSDLQAVFEGWTRGGNRLRISAYAGEDVLDLSQLSEEDAPLQFDWDWGNFAAGASWTSPMRGGGALDVKASFTRFKADLGFEDFDATFATFAEQATVRADLERRPTPRARWKSGLAASRVAYDNEIRAGGTDFVDGRGHGWETAAYTQVLWDPSSRWLVEAGVRLDHWRPNTGESETTVSPRFALKRFVRGGRSAVRVAGGRYSQFIHSRRNEELPIGLDVWVVAGERAPRVVSDQIQLAVESFFGDDDAWFGSLEGYYRTFDGVIAENTADDPNDPLDDLLTGTGRAWGVDLYARRDLGAATGWVSASFLKTDRTFPDSRSGLDPQPLITYPPLFDRRFDLDLVLRRPLGWWGLEGNLRFNFGTGLPYTRPLGTFEHYSHRPLRGGVQIDYNTAVLLGARNGARYPARHRLDVGVRKPVVRSWGRLVPYLNVVNVYNHKNALFYFFEYDRDPPARTGISMIPILPTIGVEASFR